MKSFKYILAGLVSFGLLSCEKNAVQDITGDPPQAQIKFFHFGVNAPQVNFYADDTKMTAISSATGVEATTGVSYGGVGSGGYYSSIEPGRQYTFKAKIAAATDKDLSIAEIPGTIKDQTFYSIYISGFYNTTTKKVDGFILEDQFPAVDTGKAIVRFVNAISNANAMTLYAKNTNTTEEVTIGGQVAYKSGGTFVAIPNGVYDLSARYTPTGTAAISRAAVSFSKGRIYTIGARGDITVTSTTATNRPFLDNTTNR